MTRYVPMILIGVGLNAGAQLLLKKGMISIGHFAFSASELLRIAPSVALNPFIVGGLLSYVVSVTIWMLVLSRVDVSAAYPFLSVGYVVTAVAGWLFFAEHLSSERIFGIALICVGVIWIAKS